MAEIVQTETRDNASRIKFNDIRVVGPMLVLALVGALLISPSIGAADRSVGSSINPCTIALNATAGVVGACITPVPRTVPTAAPTAAPSVVPTQVPAPPADRAFQPREKVMGPTWLGPIVPSINGGHVTMEFPVLLSVFIGAKNQVKVHGAAGEVVFAGFLPANRTISFPGPATTYTVKVELVTEADYTEIVPMASAEAVS